MRFPKNNTGRINKLAKLIYKFWNSSYFIRWLLTPVLIGILPALAFGYFSIEIFSKLVHEKFPCFAVTIDAHAWLILVAAFIYPTVLLVFARFIMHRANSNAVTQEALLILNASLDRIVGCKERRFGEFLVKIQEHGVTSSEKTFMSITQPELQIGEITRGVCELFSTLFGGTGVEKSLIKVVLAVIDDSKVVCNPFYFPQDDHPRIDLKLLNKPQSAIMAALTTKKMVIIDSTKKELLKGKYARYVSNEADERDASLICFPIIHEQTNDMPFVLSIHSEEAGVFKEESREAYDFLLKRFEHRLSLEYSLYKIKKEVTVDGRNQI